MEVLSWTNLGISHVVKTCSGHARKFSFGESDPTLNKYAKDIVKEKLGVFVCM